jgi:hypothetical protein
MDLDRWVNDNNPDEQLQYGKGWWDYIELIRRLMYKFRFNTAAVALPPALQRMAGGSSATFYHHPPAAKKNSGPWGEPTPVSSSYPTVSCKVEVCTSIVRSRKNLPWVSSRKFT